MPRAGVLVIALGAAVVGLGAAAVLGYRGAHAATIAALPSAPTKTTPLAAARPAIPAPEPAHEAPAVIAPAAPQPAADNGAAQEAAAATSALLLVSTVPSCQQLLGSDYVEKRDLAAAFAQTQVGQRELVRGNVIGAQRAFCTAALWDNANAERWLNLSQLFLIRRDGAKAAQCAQMVLTLQPNNTRGRAMLGDAWAMLGSIEEAREAYLVAEGRSEPEAEELRLMIRRDLEEAQRMVKRHDFVRAERLFRRVLIFDAGNAEASAGLTASLARLRANHEPK